MMLDDAALRAFAGFVQALLPRLLLYPGGLFVLVLSLLPARPPRAGGALLGEGAAVPALALAWAGLALLPLPGLAPLPGGPDLLLPLGLLLAATLLGTPAPPDPQAVAALGLLLTAPLATLAFAPDGSLFAPTLAPATPGEPAARVLLLLAFAAGWVATTARPRPGDRLGRLAAATTHLGWAGLALAISNGPAQAGAPAWAGPLLLAGAAGGTHLLAAWPPVPAHSRGLVTVGWGLLFVGLIGTLVPL